MDTLRIPSISPELGVRATHSAPIIIATDGRAQSDGAMLAGRLFAESADALRTVTVFSPIPMIPESPVVVGGEVEEARRIGIQNEVVEQMTRVWDDKSEIEVLVGDPASAIAEVAHRSGATMIVAGLGRHRVADRIFGDETALRLIRLADVPVFAAAEGLTHAPHRIVVACDFSETSLRAARLTLELASPRATIYLTHVAPRDSAKYDTEGWGREYRQEAGGALKNTRQQLRVPKDMTVQNVLLQGDPATELLAFATSVKADLIATGSHGHGFITRLIVGSVASRILRGAPCSVLTIPYAAAMTDVRTTADTPVFPGIGFVNR